MIVHLSADAPPVLSGNGHLSATARASPRQTRQGHPSRPRRIQAHPCEIIKLSHMIVDRGLKRPPGERAIRLSGGKPFSELYLSEAVEVVLRDSQLTLIELTL